MIKKAKDILEQWMKAVNDGDVKTLLNLYDNNAVLIPTFSNRLLNTPEKLKDYFSGVFNNLFENVGINTDY